MKRKLKVTPKFNNEKEGKHSQYLIDSIKRTEKDIKEGKVSPSFKTGKEAVEWLEKQGI